jgi:hypothetical protein
VALAGSALLVFQTWQTIQANRRTAALEVRLKDVEAQLKQAESRRADVGQTATLTKEVLGEFRNVLSASDEIRAGQLTLASAFALTIPDPQVRAGFLAAAEELNQQALARARAAVISASAAAPPAQRQEAQEKVAALEATVFSLQQAQVQAEAETRGPAPETPAADAAAVSPGSRARWSNYDFDIFWCDGVSNAASNRAIAERLALLRAADADASGRWRVRALPALTNQRAGYRVRGYEIRWSSPDEKPLADRFAAAANAVLAAGPGRPALDAGGRMVARGASQVTPWYLSAFVCPPPPPR